MVPLAMMCLIGADAYCDVLDQCWWLLWQGWSVTVHPITVCVWLCALALLLYFSFVRSPSFKVQILKGIVNEFNPSPMYKCVQLLSNCFCFWPINKSYIYAYCIQIYIYFFIDITLIATIFREFFCLTIHYFIILLYLYLWLCILYLYPLVHIYIRSLYV